MLRGKIVWRGLAAGLLVTGTVQAGAAHAGTLIDPADPNILYTGRWDFSAPSAPWAQAKGSSLSVRFEGTSISATHSGGTSEYLRVILDDDAAGSTKLQLQPGVSMELASGLTDTVHKLELIKETDQGRMTLTALQLDDGKSLRIPPPRPPRKIEFYGDSNLAGFSLESERNQSGAQLTGSHYTFAGIVARQMDAEYVNHSRSGATITALLNTYDRTDWNTPTPLWDFSRFPADLVVANIGANDSGSPNVIKQRYFDLLDTLRTAHPEPHIVLFNAWGWDFDEPANFIHEVIDEHGDPNTSARIFPWIFEQFHGCEYDHGGMAANLVEHLETVLGWSAAPADVMSGYGVNGNVANGSFEEVAPFGGWGWRYFDDAGVSRVHDPATAYDGEHFLRLANGAATHQNIPASDGETFTVNVWARGAMAGDELHITMDFRDQGAAGPDIDGEGLAVARRDVLVRCGTVCQAQKVL
ncbi:MAG: GDSL-type esterase/lipase family protein, partial [Acidobacteriota bacterium]